MLEAGTMGRALLLRAIAIILAAFCAVYVGDALIARYRIAYHRQSTLSRVTVYYSATMKNSKTMIFGGEPDTMYRASTHFFRISATLRAGLCKQNHRPRLDGIRGRLGGRLYQPLRSRSAVICAT